MSKPVLIMNPFSMVCQHLNLELYKYHTKYFKFLLVLDLYWNCCFGCVNCIGNGPKGPVLFNSICFLNLVSTLFCLTFEIIKVFEQFIERREHNSEHEEHSELSSE